ncbi:peptidoglycan-binding protein [Bacillus sp. JCM 19034]|uniref:peptidoglycan-binding domain-containing protein n=1 Tax=Bacillus sp. JCM 19034 TaxID=1481928 RepID=UPI0007844686|nr:peptidoglycan-binding domain-containing protein [Bacillus sp. JCM 19034]
MLKKARYSFVVGMTATVIVFVPVSTSLAEVTSIEESTELFVLEVGSEGSKVLDLKEALNLLGYETGTSDEFNEDTEEQVILYQEDNALSPDGKVDDVLFYMILEDAKNAVDEQNESIEEEIVEVEEVVKEVVEEVEEIIEENEEQSQMTTSSVQADSNALKRGDYDKRVIDLKIHLAIMGFEVSSNPTDFYGSVTEQMVEEFQKAYNLKTYGNC